MAHVHGRGVSSTHPTMLAALALLAAAATLHVAPSLADGDVETVEISGKVRCGLFGFGIRGVVMTGLPGEPRTDGDGEFEAEVPVGWSGQVIPRASGLHFSPSRRTYTNVTSDQDDDYETTLPYSTISGYVRTPSGDPIPGVVMSGLRSGTVTNGTGYYMSKVTSGGSGTVTPQKDGYTFTPASRTYHSVSGDDTNENYTGIPGDLPPDAVNDSATVDMNSTDNAIAVLANDSEPNDEDMTLTAVTTPAHGAAAIDGDNVLYTPETDYPLPGPTATDSFQYTVRDENGNTSTATVTVTVTRVNVAPAMLVTPAGAVDFGPVQVGQPREIDAFVVTNVGIGTLTGTVALDAPFTIVSGDTFSLAHDEQQVVRVSFAPAAETEYTSTVTFASNAGTVERTIEGEGTVQPILDVQSTHDLDFGDVFVGDISEINPAYTVSNVGTGTLEVSVRTRAPFSVAVDTGLPTSRVSFSLAAGEEKEIAVCFAPLKAGEADADIDFTSAHGRDSRVAVGFGVLPVVGIEATDDTAAEPGTDTGTFTVSRTGTTGSAMTVAFRTRGTARNGTDYERIPTTVTIPAGETSATIDITPIDDTRAEFDETATLTLRSSRLYQIDPAHDSATVTIADDEPEVAIEATDPDAAEAGPDTGEFTITRTGDTTDPLTVRFRATGTARNGSDYERIDQETTIPAGEASVTITITPIDDGRAEFDETVLVVLRPNTTYSVDLGNALATVTIADNSPTLSIEATDPDAAEAGPDTGTFTITRTGDTTDPLTVRFRVTGTARNGSDYERIAYEATIPAGEASATVTITPIDDATAEFDERVLIILRTSDAYRLDLEHAAATVTIADNSATVSIEATDPDAAETGPDTGEFTITRTGDTTNALTVSFRATGTARNGSDYERIAYEATIPAGEASATVTITPIDDAVAEFDERVLVVLRANSAYRLDLDHAAATVTIADNSASVSIEATDADAAEEGPDTGEFTISRTGDTTDPLTVHFRTNGTARSGSDYEAIGSEVTIPAGEASATITVTPIDDTLAESDERVIVALRADTSYTLDLANPAATVTIADNEASVSIEATDPDASEDGPDTGEFTVTRTGDTTDPLTVEFRATGTARNGTDYEDIGSEVTIPAGEASATITITPIDDDRAEFDEVVLIALRPNSAYGLGIADAAATVTIADNEATVSIEASDADAAEAGLDPGEFTIARTGDTTDALEVRLRVTGRAKGGRDYERIPSSVTIPAGQALVTIPVTPIDDTREERDESVIVMLRTGSAYSLDLGNLIATVTIADND